VKGAHNMKKLIALLLALSMLLCFAACGKTEKGDSADKAEESGKDDNKASASAEEEAAAKYGVDLSAEGEQKMSDERAPMDVLIETRDEWLEGKMTFALDENPKTYADFVDHIGCDASTYTNMEEDGERHYVWMAEGDDTAKFLAVFWETPQGWTLYSVGSVNIG